ncbi:MAG: helix-turn-helix domain-containing protein [Thermodesulfobacteriota bacterium]|nr:helix-turn-helix domain-containing protein [Thermodesulfobacteriota bacterium]
MSSKKSQNLIKFSDILNRIKEASGQKKDIDIANALNLKQSTFANAKKRDSIPYEALITFCNKNQINIHWLLTGEGEPFFEKTSPVYNEGDKEKPPAREKGETEYEQYWDEMGFGEAVEMLQQIYGSGNKKLIRAINANLDSFSEAATMEERISELEEQVKYMMDVIHSMSVKQEQQRHHQEGEKKVQEGHKKTGRKKAVGE